MAGGLQHSVVNLHNANTEAGDGSEIPIKSLITILQHIVESVERTSNSQLTRPNEMIIEVEVQVIKMNEDDEIKSLVGKPYLENKYKLTYGGAIDSEGIIREALTRDEFREMKSRCSVDKPNILFAEDLRDCIGCCTDTSVIDEILEFLHDQDVLTPKGIELARVFWERYIHEED